MLIYQPLLRTFVLLDRQNIVSLLNKKTRKQLSNLEILDSVDSTNTYLLNKARQGVKNGYAVLAEQQTAGRGRHGRYWHSPFGCNIYLSLLWNFNCNPAETSKLSLTVAVIVARVLEKYGIKDSIRVKWPNDIYFQEKKLAGILIETLMRKNKHSQIIIGIGLNIHQMKSDDKFIDQPWTNIEAITNDKPNRNIIAALLLNELFESLPTFESNGFSSFESDWNKKKVAN